MKFQNDDQKNVGPDYCYGTKITITCEKSPVGSEQAFLSVCCIVQETLQIWATSRGGLAIISNLQKKIAAELTWFTVPVPPYVHLTSINKARLGLGRVGG